MIKKPEDVTFIKQPTKFSCYHCCLAMVTGVHISDIFEIYPPDVPLSEEEGFAFLVQNNILPIKEIFGLGSYLNKNSVYILTTLSENHSDNLHSVLAYIDGEGSAEVFDPSQKELNFGKIVFVERLLDCSGLRVD